MGLTYSKYLISISYISPLNISMRLGEQELKQSGRLLSIEGLTGRHDVDW